MTICGADNIKTRTVGGLRIGAHGTFEACVRRSPAIALIMSHMGHSDMFDITDIFLFHCPTYTQTDMFIHTSPSIFILPYMYHTECALNICRQNTDRT